MFLSSRDFENNVNTPPPKKGATAICCEQDR
jgi:hypothetical protein